MRQLAILFSIVFSINISLSQNIDTNHQKKWVDSVYNSLTFEEKVGQLFMVAAYSNKKEDHFNDIDKLISDYKIGGLIFFQGGPVRQAKLTNRYQAKSKVPLLIGIDAEWGLSMRLDSTVKYPWNMTLGAIKDVKLIENMGSQMAQQCKRLGVHFTFGPVVDINTNPNNPIIGNRSYGELKENVSEKALAYMKGLQNGGVFATAKHFPGHGDTETDSHLTLPIVKFQRDRLNEVELYPYRELIKNGLSSIMVAHLNVPSIEERPGYPTSISYKAVTEILKNELNFKGLIFTDALNMKGASNFLQPGDIDLEAFLAGNDILLFPENVPKAILKFKEAFESNKLDENRLKESVIKILNHKYLANLQNFKSIEINNLYSDLNQPEYQALIFKMFENAITLLKNDSEFLPIKKLDKEKIAYIKLGEDNHEPFLNQLKDHADVTEISAFNLDTALIELTPFTKVIIGYHKPDNAWKKNELTLREIYWIDRISKEKQTILTVFSKPYSLNKIPEFSNIKSVLLAYQNNENAQKIAADIIFGAKASKGNIPVTIKKDFIVKDGIYSLSINRLGCTIPENVGMKSSILNKIDEIAEYAIKERTTPGMQIVVARKGQIVFKKSYGHHTYEKVDKVKNSDLYDVASLTKILSTLPMVMHQYDLKKINFNTHLCEMLPDFENSNKSDATLLDMLTHQARFQAWIPFYKSTLDSLNQPLKTIYNIDKNEEFQWKVADNLYIKKSYNDSILNQIKNSSLLTTKQYKYSDFTFILLKEYLEKSTHETLDNLIQKHFYSKLGMHRTMYNPLNRLDKVNIPPTEIDTYFRYQTIKGYVHDMAAAMQGGVAGHAGIFSNATDVAKMMQMYLQKGNYGDEQFVSEKTFNEFNTCYFCKDGNRRGVGFDKPQLSGDGPTCGCTSFTSFGHTGFTGTIAWADPEKELVYVFLSNRTFPNSEFNKLSKLNIREKIQEIIYDSIID